MQDKKSCQQTGRRAVPMRYLIRSRWRGRRLPNGKPAVAPPGHHWPEMRDCDESATAHNYSSMSATRLCNIFFVPDRGKPHEKGSKGESKWRRDRDSNPGYPFEYTRFPSVRLQPLGHLSVQVARRNRGTATGGHIHSIVSRAICAPMQPGLSSLPSSIAGRDSSGSPFR